MIGPILPELATPEQGEPFDRREFSSADEVVGGDDLTALLARYGVVAGTGQRV